MDYKRYVRAIDLEYDSEVDNFHQIKINSSEEIKHIMGLITYDEPSTDIDRSDVDKHYVSHSEVSTLRDIITTKIRTNILGFGTCATIEVLLDDRLSNIVRKRYKSSDAEYYSSYEYTVLLSVYKLFRSVGLYNIPTPVCLKGNCLYM